MFSFFNLFKSKGQDSPKRDLGPGGPMISALLLESDSFPVDSFLRQLAPVRFDGKSATRMDRGNGEVFSFSLGDEFFALAIMPAPYPGLEGPIATTWMWPKQPPIDDLKRHRSHLLITGTGGTADPVKRRLKLTAVTALAAKQTGVMAVYWPEATLIHFPPLFIDMAEKITSAEAPPLYLWVDLRALRNEDGTTAMFTTGLSALGHKEIEIPRIDMAPGDLREWLFNIICYLLEKGPVLLHGQTIGMTAEQQIQIRHCPSSFGHSGTVIRLEP